MHPDQDSTIIGAMTDFALQAEELGFDAVFCPLMMGVALRESGIQRAVNYGWSA